MPKKDMQKEIFKYQGRIYYYDAAACEILPAEWIKSLSDYNHCECELHHVVPFTDWENNTKNIQSIVEENALILLPKVMHQHLENPLYKLRKDDFERIYGIHPDLILYDINSRAERLYPQIFLNNFSAGKCCSLPADFLLSDEDLACFDDCEPINSRKAAVYG